MNQSLNVSQHVLIFRRSIADCCCALYVPCDTVTTQQVVLADIKAIATDNCAANVHRIRNLMRHLFNKHPPRDGSVIGETQSDKLKSSMLKCIRSYHPDKQVQDTDVYFHIVCNTVNMYKGVTEQYKTTQATVCAHVM
jgi:hypothetical protein